MYDLCVVTVNQRLEVQQRVSQCATCLRLLLYGMRCSVKLRKMQNARPLLYVSLYRESWKSACPPCPKKIKKTIATYKLDYGSLAPL